MRALLFALALALALAGLANAEGSAAPTYISQLGSRDPQVVKLALVSAEQSLDFRALPALVNVVRWARDPNAQRMATRIIIRMIRRSKRGHHGEVQVSLSGVAPLLVAGRRAVPELIAALERDDSEGIPAAFALGEIGGTEARLALLAQFRRAQGAKLVYVADGLRKLREPTLIELLAGRWNGYSGFGPSLFSVLSRIGPDWENPVLQGLLSPNENTRDWTSWFVARYSFPILSPRLRDAYARSTGETRRNLFEALAHSGALESRALMFSKIEDTEDAFRIPAFRYFSIRPDTSVAPVMVRSLSSKNEIESTYAATILGKLRYRPAINSLVSLINRGESAQEYVDALARIGTPEANSYLLELMSSSRKRSESTRANAANALAYMKPALAKTAVLRGLSDPSQSIQTACAVSAGKLKIREAIPALTRMLYREDSSEVWAPLQALKRIGGPAQKVVDQYLRGGTEDDIAQLNRPLDVLGPLASSSDHWVRERAAEAACHRFWPQFSTESELY